MSIGGAPYRRLYRQKPEISVIATRERMNAIATQLFPNRYSSGMRNPPPKPTVKMCSG
jgi:hypothetical protein